jgi:hypothetical protein
MNLAKHKTLVIFGTLLLVGCVAFGYLFFSAWSGYLAADAKYTKQLAERKRLKSLPLYPEPANLRIVEEQKKTAARMAEELFEKVRPTAFPLEKTTPDQFQQKLNATVQRLAAKAAEQGVKLGLNEKTSNFYLGFDEYKTAVPSPAAATALGRQLKCIELAVETLIDKKVDAIVKITRERLPEEAVAGATPTPAPVRGAGKGKTEEPAQPLVSKYPFRVAFVAEQKVFQNALNDLSKNDRQFFIIVPESLKNQSDKSPKRNDPNAKRNDIAQGQTLRYVLGAEKLAVTLRFDTVVFADKLPQ